MLRTTLSEERVVEGISPPAVLAEHVARYAFAAKYVRGLRVLDLACGSGYGTDMLKRAGAAEVVGVDLDPESVQYARDRYETDGLSFLEGDACDPPDCLNSHPFDLIVSFETIEHLDRPSQFLDVCGRLLAPSGMLLVSSPHRHRVTADGKPANPYHHQEWTTAEFEKLMHFHFGEVGLYGQLHKVNSNGIPLPRRLAGAVGKLQGYPMKNPNKVYPLPGPTLFGLWQTYPAYLIAACRKPR
jgi:O-antigen biosynthesis protein